MFYITKEINTPYRYYQNGLDVTYYVMNQLALPMGERFFEVTCR